MLIFKPVQQIYPIINFVHETSSSSTTKPYKLFLMRKLYLLSSAFHLCVCTSAAYTEKKKKERLSCIIYVKALFTTYLIKNNKGSKNEGKPSSMYLNMWKNMKKRRNKFEDLWKFIIFISWVFIVFQNKTLSLSDKSPVRIENFS